jgi:mRNA interferase RelE/StbE
MTSFVVILTPEAQQDILRLDVSVQTRILDKLDWMGENAEFIRHQMLKGAEGYNCFKYRVGDYRIVYSLDMANKRLVVLKVGHRRDVYR